MNFRLCPWDKAYAITRIRNYLDCRIVVLTIASAEIIYAQVFRLKTNFLRGARMRHIFVVVFALVIIIARPVFATFSIVAIDPETGDLGAAVASRVFGAGFQIMWAEVEVGAVVTQAHLNGGYGPRGLELLKEGLTAQQVVDQLLAEDPYPRKEGRQVAIVDAKGNVAVYTGPIATDWRGHIKGKTYSVQGNVLAGPHVAEAMAQTFEETKGELAERLYAALKAGDDAGGDRRGRQSAGLLVVRKGGGSAFNNDRLCYINVNDSKDPMRELGRLLPLQLAWSLRGKRAPLVAEGKFEEAMTLADKIVRWEPHNGPDGIHQGFIAYLIGDKKKSRDSFQKAREIDPDGFQASWNNALCKPKRDVGPCTHTDYIDAAAEYAKVINDKDFVEQILD